MKSKRSAEKNDSGRDLVVFKKRCYSLQYKKRNNIMLNKNLLYLNIPHFKYLYTPMKYFIYHLLLLLNNF